MGPDVHLDVQVTRWPAIHAGLPFPRQTDPVTFINACRHLHRQRLLLFNLTKPLTGGTWVLDLFTPAMTVRAGLLHREEALLHANLAHTVTGGTIHGG